jgi:CDP-glucose 4,6-dehydratase
MERNCSLENQLDADAPHEANFLKLDCAKLKNTFGWKPRWHIDEAVEKTCRWSKVWLEGGEVPAEIDREISEFLKPNT